MTNTAKALCETEKSHELLTVHWLETGNSGNYEKKRNDTNEDRSKKAYKTNAIR